MTQKPEPHHETDGDVYVSPRHLASTTGIGDPAFAPLLDLGWSIEHDDHGNAYTNAPDLKVRVGYLPEGEDDGLWRINAYRDPFGPPTWGTCFKDRTPTEFVTAFTTALATAYEQGPATYLARPVARIDEHDPFLAVVPLLKHGWEIDRPRWGVFAIQAPDGLAGMEFTTGDLDPEAELSTRNARWQLWAGKSIDRPVWYATASTDTPVALLTAVTECVADPAPLPRWRQDTYSYIKGDGPAHPDPPAGSHTARRTAGRRIPPPGRAARSQRPALEHHQPTCPVRPPPIGPPDPDRRPTCPSKPQNSTPSCASPSATTPSWATPTSPPRPRRTPAASDRLRRHHPRRHLRGAARGGRPPGPR